MINIIRSFLSSFGILFLVVFFVLYLAVRDSVTIYISGSLLDNLASDEIKILPKNASSIEFVKKPGSNSIAPQVLSRIQKMDELIQVHPVSRTGFNVRFKAELMGKSKSMYVPVCGIDRAIIKGKVPNWKSFHNKKPVPIIIPKFTIDIMNNLLNMEGMPTFGEKDLIGFPVELRFRTGDRNSERYKAYDYEALVHGFTDILSFPGIIMPTDFLIEVAAQYKKETGIPSSLDYIVVYAKVKDSNALPAVVSKLKKMGLSVESQSDITEKTAKTLRIIDGVFFAIMAIFFIVSAISIFNSYLTIVYIRSQKFSLKRVLGFSKIRILVTFVLEAALIGAIYGVAGYFAGNYILSFAGEIISKWVPALQSVTFHARNFDVLFMCVGISSAVSAVSAFIPAVFASNINLFKAVRR
jgi:ABC-type lipoprotein release transport system permease subunit